MADFHSWSHHNLADLAVELQAENEMLQAANEQLRKDLREAMAVIRDLNRNAVKNRVGFSEVTTIIDARVPELQENGTTLMRDPKTLQAYDVHTGEEVK